MCQKKKKTSKKRLSISKAKINSSQRKIHFCFKFFNFSNIDETLFENDNNYRKKWSQTFDKMKSLSHQSVLETLEKREIILRNDEKAIALAKGFMKDQDFAKLYKNNIYDLFQENSIRVLGLLNGTSGCFNILMFDLIDNGE